MLYVLHIFICKPSWLCTGRSTYLCTRYVLHSMLYVLRLFICKPVWLYVSSGVVYSYSVYFAILCCTYCLFFCYKPIWLCVPSGVAYSVFYQKLRLCWIGDEITPSHAVAHNGTPKKCKIFSSFWSYLSTITGDQSKYCRTYGRRKNLNISLFLQTILGPI